MSAPVSPVQPKNPDAPVTILRGWAKAYRDSPEHRFPSDPHAEFFPVDMEAAANRIEELERKFLMFDGTRALESIGIDTHAAMVDLTKETMGKLIAAEAALRAAKEFADDEFSNTGDLNRKNRISRLCDKIDAALQPTAEPVRRCKHDVSEDCPACAEETMAGLKAALLAIKAKTEGNRPTVNEQNAFEHFAELNARLVEIRALSRTALTGTRDLARG